MLKEILINIFHFFVVWKDKDSKEVRANSVEPINKKNKKQQQQKDKAKCIPSNPQREVLWSYILPGCLKAGSLGAQSEKGILV